MDAPHDRPVRRLDEVRAAKHLVVKYEFEQHQDLSGGNGGDRRLEAQKSNP